MITKFILLLIFVAIIIQLLKKYFLKSEQFSEKPIIWLYWENKPNSLKPSYLNLCYKTVLKHCKDSFDIHLLDEKTVYKYLPDLRKDINQLMIPQKADYIRICLLYKYGGIWLDSDIIVNNDLKPMYDKMEEEKVDYIGFGCHYKNCIDKGYPYPANWVMISKKNTKFMSECLKACNNYLDNYNVSELKSKKNYFIFGRKLLWKKIKSLKKNNNWDYYHYDSKCLDRDFNYKKIRNNRHLSNENIDEKCNEFRFFTPIYNTAPGFPNNFLKLSENEILEKNILISKLFKKSLNL